VFDGGAVVDECGVCEGDGSSCDCTDYSLYVGGGSYDNEISWDISDAAGNVVLSGAAMTTNEFICLSDGDYTFNGYDSWGDGWNGAFFEIADWQGNVIANGTVAGSSQSWDFCLGADCEPVVDVCEDCEFDWSPYGAECCDAALDAFGLNCATLEGNYFWDCAGCACSADECTADADCAEGQTCEG
jgi:hypothetical protein